nr:MAG TPA: hypothetical protein [Caudoviricetes sp.]
MTKEALRCSHSINYVVAVYSMSSRWCMNV